MVFNLIFYFQYDKQTRSIYFPLIIWWDYHHLLYEIGLKKVKNGITYDVVWLYTAYYKKKLSNNSRY